MNGAKEEKKVKLLGLWVDSRYEFIDHVNHLIKVCRYKLSCVRKVANWLTDDNLQLVVTSLIISHVTFCSEIYLRLPKTQRKIQKLIYAAARVATRSDRYANCETMMEKLGWYNADNLYRNQLLTSLRRQLGTGSSYYMQQWLDFQSRSGMRTRLIRLTWKHLNNFGKLAYLQAAVKEWNKMEVGRKLFEDMKAFKEWIQKEIHCLYGNPNLR